MAPTAARFPPPETARELTQRATIATVVAVAAVLLVQAVVNAAGLAIGSPGPMSPFAPPALVGTTVVAGAAATVAYAGLVRFTERPVRNFLALSSVVFVLQLVPVVVFAPTLGVTATGQAVLVVYHVLVAVPIVGFLLGVAPVPGR